MSRPSLCAICLNPITSNQKTVRYWDADALKTVVAHADCVGKEAMKK